VNTNFYSFQKRVSEQGRAFPILWGVIFLAIANCVVSVIDFDRTQDIAAYAENIDNRSDQLLITEKGGWYRYLVFPLAQITGDTEVSLVIVRALTLTLMLSSQRHYFRNRFSCALFLVVLLVSPPLLDNLNEYLRQGTALGVLMLGVSLSPGLLVPAAVVAILIHPAAVVPVAAIGLAFVVDSVGISKIWYSNHFFPLCFAAIAFTCGIYGVNLVSWLDIETANRFMSGSRENLFGLLFLAVLSAYTGLQYTANRSNAHLPVFIMFVIITSSYAVISDFGRTMALVFPFHLAAAMTLPAASNRYADFAVVLTAGVVPSLPALLGSFVGQ